MGWFILRLAPPAPQPKQTPEPSICAVATLWHPATFLASHNSLQCRSIQTMRMERMVTMVMLRGRLMRGMVTSMKETRCDGRQLSVQCIIAHGQLTSRIKGRLSLQRPWIKIVVGGFVKYSPLALFFITLVMSSSLKIEQLLKGGKGCYWFS